MPTTHAHGAADQALTAMVLECLPGVRFRSETTSRHAWKLILGVALPDDPEQRAACVEEDAAAVVGFLEWLPVETYEAVARLLGEKAELRRGFAEVVSVEVGE